MACLLATMLSVFLECMILYAPDVKDASMNIFQKTMELYRYVLAVSNLAKASPGFVDRLIHGEYFANSKTTVACEKSFKKLPLAEVFAVSDKSSNS